MSEIVKEFYGQYVRKEWRRLVRDAYHGLEFATTLHFLSKYLPPSGLVLDAGGGPGRYTMELARRGYQVVLLDYTPANLEFARRRIRRLPADAPLRKNVRAVVEGSITDLSQFADATFDAVVCTGGPLSHVVDAEQRDRAVDELVRVAKPGAPLFVSAISRLSVFVVELTIAQSEIEEPPFVLMRDTGDYFGGFGFTEAHFFYPEELRAAFAGKPVTVLEMAGLEGVGSGHRREINRLAKSPERWKVWMETHFATCTHPSVVGLSEHMLIVCRKKA